VALLTALRTWPWSIRTIRTCSLPGPSSLASLMPGSLSLRAADGTQRPWKPYGTRTGRWTRATGPSATAWASNTASDDLSVVRS
jgi:hypothetical protein